jgi:hypothetical protein
MPNWCNNTLVIKPIDDKDEKSLEQFRKIAKKLEVDFEFGSIGDNIFNRLYPMPESLKVTSGSMVDAGIAVILSEEEDNHLEIEKMLEYAWVKEEGISTKEELIKNLKENNRVDLEQARISIENIKKYGLKNWYDWARENWGTKWDSGEIHHSELIKDEIISIVFDTAWSPPCNLLLNIAEEYDLLYFEMEYEEAGVGFEGTTIVDGGAYSDEERECDYTKQCEDCPYDVDDCEWEGKISCPSGVREWDCPEDENECPFREALNKKKKKEE